MNIAGLTVRASSRPSALREGLFPIGGTCGVGRLQTRGGRHHIGRMCGRYASFLPAEALARAFGTTGLLPNLEPAWNMAPTKDAPIVR
jgi:hypothetical protein